MGGEEQNARDHKDAHDALEIVKNYAAFLKGLSVANLNDVTGASRKARDMLKDASLPYEVARVVETSLDVMLDVQIDSYERLEEVLRQEGARAEEERKRELERANEESERKKEQKRELLGKVVISATLVAFAVVLAFKDAAPWACVAIFVFLYVQGYKAPFEAALKLFGKRDDDGSKR